MKINIGDKVRFMGKYNGEQKVRYGKITEIDYKNDMCTVVEELPFGYKYFWNLFISELHFDVEEDEIQQSQRLSWDEYFKEITLIVAKRSGCLSRQVGAVIVKDNRILATGYNANPLGVQECCDKGYCLRKNNKSGENLEECYAVHGEQNAITQCAKNGISCEGATLYVTCMPCNTCAKLIINSGIKEVVYFDEYNSPLATEVLTKAGIKLRKI